jgi:hypothetical protein
MRAFEAELARRKWVMDVFSARSTCRVGKKYRAIHEFPVDGFFELLLFCGVDWKRCSKDGQTLGPT